MLRQKNFIRPLMAASFIALAGCVSAEVSGGGSVAASLGAEQGSFERDRAAILAMAGNYKVTFDFIESVSFVEGYELKDRKLSGGDEIVRVIEDRGDYISMQHILVVGGEEGFPVKHWRQDWYYEPESVLTYVGANHWEKRAIPAEDAKGKWSQIVYQVDDSPRYGALAAWDYTNGVPEWTPPKEWRPLPRRDATTRDDYHTIDAVNRHAIAPWGWVHEQDNSKVVLDGEAQILARELAINTYRKFDDFSIAVGDDYWAASADYWAGVRDIWFEIEATHKRFGITIEGETQELYMQVLGFAQGVVDGEMTSEEAVAEARTVIESFLSLPASK